MATIIANKTISINNVVHDGNSAPIDLRGGDSYSIQAVIDENTGDPVDFLSGESEVTTLTFADDLGTDDGDYVVIYDTLGLGWAVAARVAPTGALWLSIPAARKGITLLAGASDAASVAAAFEVAFDALASVPFATDDSAADGTMLVTVTIRGNTTDAVTKNADDNSSGSIVEAQTNQGVASNVDVVANTVTIADHGYPTGLVGELTSTGTLPGGLSTSTSYYIISVDANTISFADTYDHALAGTAINITNQGTDGATNTFTPDAITGGEITFQKSNDAVNWSDIAAGTAITVDAAVWLDVTAYSYAWVRASLEIDSGSFTVDLKLLIKSISPVASANLR